MSKFIDVQNINFAYDKQNNIIKNISCSIDKQKITVIAGPNGCGKTTLLRLISKNLNPQSGEILFSGNNIKNITAKDYAKDIALVSQQNETVPVTVYDYISLGRIPHSSFLSLFLSEKDKAIINEKIELCGISEIKNKILTELSSGQKQLVRIVRALTQEPKILLLDEPTSNLDIKHQIHTLDMVSHLAKTLSLAVVIVIHDLNLAVQYGDNIILMKSGKIESAGKIDNIFEENLLNKIYETPVSIYTEQEKRIIQADSHINTF